MFQYNCEVFYEDTDMGGRVYHANYFKFIERARSKLIESISIDQRALLLEEKKFFVVKNITADYQLPAYFGDNLVICTSLVELKNTFECESPKTKICFFDLISSDIAIFFRTIYSIN